MPSTIFLTYSFGNTFSIALANEILDPFDVPVGTYLRIPPLVSLYNTGGVLSGN